MLQALVLWSTMGLLLSAVGFEYNTWQFWCFLGLFWCVERIGRQYGNAEGIIRYLSMTDAEQDRIRKLIKDNNND